MKIIAILITIAAIGFAANAGAVAAETSLPMNQSWIEIDKGSFTQGSDSGFYDVRPAHEVVLTKPFKIASRPVTNAEFEAFDPSHKKGRGAWGEPKGDDDPVRGVTWDAANAYCKWLSDREGKSYRLPTEAEWEAAFSARGADLQTPHEQEDWCLDWYGPYAAGKQIDPAGYVSGDFRVTRGLDWMPPLAPEGAQTASQTRTGELPEARNPVIGFRLVEAGPAPAPKLHDRETPIWATDVSQARFDWKPSIDMSKPYFGEPLPILQIPLDAGGPLFHKHNHDPGLCACPNGDILAIWYSTNDEPGRELRIAASRLRKGADHWDKADLFWDTPGRNDHAPALWWDGKNTIYHFNGITPAAHKGALNVIMRTSTDSGRTWSKARLITDDYVPGAQPIGSVFQSADGTIYVPCDATGGAQGGSVLLASKDNAKTWTLLSKGAPKPDFREGGSGAWIAGIHTGVAQWTDGALVAIGRRNDINGRMPMSVSHDGGLSWTYSATPFPPVSFGQRPVLRRLKEGALMLVSYTPPAPFVDSTGKTFTGEGMFVALSKDGGKTWPVQKLLTDGVKRHLVSPTKEWTHDMDATHAEKGGYMTAVQTPDGMIHLISSAFYYHFNYAWINQPNILAAASDKP
ncbi:MAG: SUMF1/EgtB/PvdO family nonheme iron enzyme [Capsulimonadaceae bacterium]|nr:SUMF1/EgtB/PvdO family nonheme iron enzyme [Capsulimonadaceae bacterium]